MYRQYSYTPEIGLRRLGSLLGYLCFASAWWCWQMDPAPLSPHMAIICGNGEQNNQHLPCPFTWHQYIDLGAFSLLNGDVDIILPVHLPL
ncbi:hypothetical protein M431DRAFT_506749 [Trichoderma harzianum CBS 226.95]|uniref:Uncharacterized protein n=1 Tax=Trichoderma harzianum CBS 226.95 TaxID=983964 RepID=A0A2T4AIW5_TRIHA|nr:hypothetical protein M431DRAFT_506749 [Trichoderma harzianum CBS 226.95]PTB57011.1 hypothetical protein M431DRAFT_506749 [Trichoderma harzianum CBS 226.95]